MNFTTLIACIILPVYNISTNSLMNNFTKIHIRIKLNILGCFINSYITNMINAHDKSSIDMKIIISVFDACMK